MKRIFYFLLMAATSLGFISCEKSDSEPKQDPPKPVTIKLRFYVNQDQVDYTNITFLSKLDTCLNWSPLSATPTLTTLDSTLDKDFFYFLSLQIDPYTPRVYQYTIDLLPGTHKFKMTFARNATTSPEEVNLLAGITGITPGGNSTHNEFQTWAGVSKAAFDGTYLEQYVNTDYNIYSIKVEKAN